MGSKYWLKLYHEIIDDPKMGRLPDNLWRRFIELLCMAGEMDMDGRLPAIHDIAWRLRIEEESLKIEFDQMARIGLIDFINKPLDEHWVVVNFSKRQRAQTASERGKIFRDRQRKQTYYEDKTLTERNTNDTFADKDIDIDKEEEGATSQKLPPETYWTGPKIDKFIREVSGISVNLDISRLQNVKNAIINYGEDRAKEALFESFKGWCATKSKESGRNYSPYTLGWIDWGIEYLLNNVKRWETQPKSFVEQLKAAGYADHV